MLRNKADELGRVNQICTPPKDGIQPKIAINNLDHSSTNITLDLYSHVLPDMQREVAEKIESGIFKKLEVMRS